jgi:hypothetical protein
MELTSGTSIDSFRPRFDGAAISTYVLAMLSVPVKLWCRSRVSGMQSLGWDDFLCVITLIFSNGWFWVTMIGMSLQTPASGMCVRQGPVSDTISLSL